MNFNRFATVTFALFLGVTGLGCASAMPTGASSQGYGQERGGWDAPPAELQDIQRQGYRDGIIGAQKDFDNHRQFNPNNETNTAIPVFHRSREAYRDGFRRGYQRGVAHLTGQDQQPPPREPERGGPGMRPGPGNGPGPGVAPAPGPGNDIRIRGFQDGMDGALRDLDNHRPPDPNNRDEFRHPNNVPYQMQDVYRDGFRAGYQRGIAVLTGGPGSDRRFEGLGLRCELVASTMVRKAQSGTLITTGRLIRTIATNTVIRAMCLTN